MPNRLLAACVLVLALTVSARAERQQERLDRGVIAVRKADDHVFVSWRMFGTDPDTVAFDLYRQVEGADAEKLNTSPLDKVTWFRDDHAPLGKPITYVVRLAGEGAAAPGLTTSAAGEDAPARSDSFTLPVHPTSTPGIWFPIDPPFGYRPNDASTADLDGDGRFDLVIHMVGQGRDNSQNGETTPPWLFAYKLDGTLIWKINLGRNIREGAHYTQFMVYDLDGDGRAEVACKTADGTVDGVGKPIGDASADHVNRNGRILDGPEYLTIFDGKTGAALATVDYIPGRGDVSAWGDSTGNRVDRFLACIAYLDGQRPSLVMARGYYTRAVVAAWDYRSENGRDGKLTRRWTFDSDDGTPGNEKFRGQGNHNLSVGDVDGDGRDEIVYGSAVIDDDGRGLYATGFGHGDAMHMTDHDPDNPGLEVFKANGDKPSDAGIQMRDARTGKQLWGIPCPDPEGVPRACAMDIDPRHPGSECWGLGQGIGGLYDCKGNKIADRAPRICNAGAWWDGDLQRELLNGVDISKWDYENGREEPLLRGLRYGMVSNNGTKSNPCLCADILGDWREEIISSTIDGRAIVILTTTIPTEYRVPTLMHDPVYRLGVAWQNVAYNQPAHLSYYLGAKAKPVESSSVAAK